MKKTDKKISWALTISHVLRMGRSQSKRDKVRLRTSERPQLLSAGLLINHNKSISQNKFTFE
jgi:hypothetical protein